MAAIGDLVSTLRMNTKPFEGGATRAKTALGRMEQTAGNMMAKVGVGPIAAVTAGVAAITAGFAAATYAAQKAVRAFAAFGDNLDKMSGRIGVSVEFLGQLAHAATLGGSDMKILEGGIRRLQRTALDAGRGLSTAVDAFNAVGVSTTDINGNLKDTRTLFMQTTAALAGVKNNTERAALAQMLFGRAGTALLPMLKDGKSGLHAMMMEADRLGLVLSTRDATAAAELTDEMYRLQAVMKIQMFKLVADAVPLLTSALQRLIPVLSGTRMFILKLADSLTLMLKYKTMGMVGWINDMHDAAKKALADAMNDFNSFKPVDSGIPPMIDDIGNSAKKTMPILDQFAKAIAGIIKARQDVAKKISDVTFDIRTHGMENYEKEAQRMRDAGHDPRQIDIYIKKSKELLELQAKTKKHEADSNAAYIAKARGDAIKQALETPLETFRREIKEYQGLYKIGALGEADRNRAQDAARNRLLESRKKPTPDPQQAKALMLGSAEAMNRILGAGRQSQQERDAKETAENTRRTADSLIRIENKPISEVSIP